ncbi:MULTISPECIES: YceI family protein [Roseobacteraceae]|jgi:polyisoprenoid-binding protein YceI|uniref:Polyisoprenoid-binding protein n=1 Tax=Pseudosulfitobacter pseudonitzschiae TaxID=1402135 RepID=A0A221JYU4_9RHOB|nr:MULTISPECIES: YceI family protein [Roseobacteraceae]ASM71906.1 polyisoprenoid-binding protein [Pseudosulfitobacter pseudonitzschiae]
MKSLLLATALSTAATMSFAADTYTFDPGHSQIVFHYEHLGFSTTYGMFSGFDGEISFDQEDPAKSSVSVSFPATSMITGWEPRLNHFMTDDFFGASEDDMVTFTSTSIEVTGDDTALITGDLTMNDITKPVVLDAKLTQMGDHPQAGKPWAGFSATTSVMRTDFDMGMFAPYVGDQVDIIISIEAMKAD